MDTHGAFRTREVVAHAPRRGLFNGGVADGVGRVRDGCREGERGSEWGEGGEGQEEGARMIKEPSGLECIRP